MLRLSRDLFLGRVALAQRHRNELPDRALLNAVPVQPRLVGSHHVVLRVSMKPVSPFFPRDCIDLPGGDFHGERVATVKVHPKGLRLIHRQHHSAVFLPQLREQLGVIIDVPKWKGPQARREGVIPSVVGNPEGPLNVHGQSRIRMDIRKTKGQLVVLEFDHFLHSPSYSGRFTGLPLPVAHLPHESQNRMVWRLLQAPDQLGEERGALADDLLEVG